MDLIRIHFIKTLISELYLHEGLKGTSGFEISGFFCNYVRSQTRARQDFFERGKEINDAKQMLSLLMKQIIMLLTDYGFQAQ